MLVPDHFFLFLEVGNCLGQTLLENLNLVLASFDLVSLHGVPLSVLFFSALVDRDFSLNSLVFMKLVLDFSLLLLEFVALGDCL